MDTFILKQDPSRSETKKDEEPAKEIGDSIRRIRAGENIHATTAWGGWSIAPKANVKQIKPDDRLLFYRTKSPCGFFAVGCALPAADAQCRKLRENGLRGRFGNQPGIDRVEPVDSKVLAAFRAVSWETGEWEGEKGKCHYINAKWDVVAPSEDEVLVPFELPQWPIGSGHRPPKEGMDVDDICKRCMKAKNALHAKQPGNARE